MITFQLLGKYGRLGNQMFQYATLYSIAKFNSYNFGIPFSKNRNEKNQFQDLCLQDCFDNLSALDSSNCVPQQQAVEINNFFDPSFFNIEDNTDILGYFQTEKYFLQFRESILKEFKFKLKICDKILNIKNQFYSELTAVHMRFGDYTSLSHIHTNANTEYYKNALSMIPKESDVILFSDDLQKASELMNQIKRNYFTFPELNRYEDMCFMTMADYHVIANSSFSWWGSWLSNSKQTIAPKHWFAGGPGSPASWDDIYSSDWIVI